MCMVCQQSLVGGAAPLQAIDWGTRVQDGTLAVYFAQATERFDGLRSEGFNGYEIARFRAAFDLIETVVPLRFEVVAAAVDATVWLVLDTNEINGEYLAYFNPPGTQGAGVGVFDGTGWDRFPGGDLEAGGQGFVTITHELLHGLGLAHPHDDGGGSQVMAGVTAQFDDYGTEGLNQGVYTTMSYNGGLNTAGAASRPSFDRRWGLEIGPMALDIAVLQAKYGANSAHAGGDDVYVLPTQNAGGTGWRAIWDTGGLDEIRAGDDRAVTIDLRPATLQAEAGGGGYLSQADGIAGGFTLAAGVVIEAARGGAGDDWLIGNDAANALRGGAGADRMEGGRGNDTYFVDSPGDVVAGEIGYALGGGIDTVRTFIDYTQPDNIELVRLGFIGGRAPLSAVGNDAPGTLVGNAGANSLTGRGGDDQINGNGGDDVLIGNTGADTLVGGDGADTFVYLAYADSRAGAGRRDVINGLTRSDDVIDLRALDADTTSFGTDDAFTFIGGAGFSAAGQLRLQSLGGADAVLVEADHNGDGVADLQIFVNLATTLGTGDFLL